MRVARLDRSADKGWYAGPWNSDLPIPVGYANAGIDEPHFHQNLFEVYLVAAGTSVIRIEQESVPLGPGDVAIVEPGEAHTFLENSADYHHFVVHAPRRGHELTPGDKTPVGRERLGL
jgi:mannose-6-phosphate isomerase-like protein (cupin superfamily)